MIVDKKPVGELLMTPILISTKTAPTNNPATDDYQRPWTTIFYLLKLFLSSSLVSILPYIVRWCLPLMWILTLLSVHLYLPRAHAHIISATCQICNTLSGTTCDGFLGSVPLRTAPQIITTAIITGCLAAWKSAGSGEGSLVQGSIRTLMQAFVPEIALFRLHRIGYAMYPKFDESIRSTRHNCDCDQYTPTKAQIVAVSLGLLAVRDDSSANSSPPRDAAHLLQYVNDSRGWRDVKFHEKLRAGYRTVRLDEAVHLPHLFHALPKGRKTFLNVPVPQVPMVLLFIQAAYYIIYVFVRASQGLYTTVIEWFFIPTSCTLMALGLSAILWEPAWRDVAHLNINLGEPLEKYPWSRKDIAMAYFGFIICLVVPIGPITTLVAYATELHHRPTPVSQVLCVMGIIWSLGFGCLVLMFLLGKYRPFKRAVVGEPREDSGWGLYYSILLVFARAITFVVGMYEISNLPSLAYTQMSWSQYFPHL